MKRSPSRDALPLPVVQALRKLGRDVATARKLRGVTTMLMAERAMIARGTLVRVEKGDPGVSLGTYASVLFVLGLAHRLSQLADVSNDPVGAALMQDRVPKRVRPPRPLKVVPGAA